MKLTEVTKELKATLANVPAVPISHPEGKEPKFLNEVNLAADHAKDLLTGPNKNDIFIDTETVQNILNTRRTDLYSAAMDLKGSIFLYNNSIKKAFLDYSIYDEFEKYCYASMFVDSFEFMYQYFSTNRLLDNDIIDTICNMDYNTFYNHTKFIDMLFKNKSCKYLINTLYMKLPEYEIIPMSKFGILVKRYKDYYPLDQYNLYTKLMDIKMATGNNNYMIDAVPSLSSNETIFEEGMYPVSSPLYVYMKNNLMHGRISIIHNIYYKYNSLVSGLHFKIDMSMLGSLNCAYDQGNLTDFDFDKFEEYGIFVDDCCKPLSSENIRERLHSYRLHNNWSERLNIYNPKLGKDNS